MTIEEWETSSEAQAMIRWISGNPGSGELLWEFTAECLLRIVDQLPGEEFRRVVRHFQTVGVHDLDDVLKDASGALTRLEKRAAKCSDDAKFAVLNRQIGFAGMVFALEFQAPEEAAADISTRLMEWAAEPNIESRLQADALRRLFAKSSAGTGYQPVAKPLRP